MLINFGFVYLNYLVIRKSKQKEFLTLVQGFNKKMSFYLLKVLFTGCLIVLITEVSKVSGKIGGIITAMPLTTILVVFWLYYENVPNEEISNYVKNTLYFILPTLPLFIIFPFLISRYGFFTAISLSMLSIIIAVLIVNTILEYFNI